MIEVPKEDHGGEHPIVMILINDIVGIILAQLKQRLLTDLQELVLIGRILLQRLPRQRITKHKGDQHQIKEREGVHYEVGGEGEPHHLEEVLLTGLGLLVVEAGAWVRAGVPRVEGGVT
jgi:hypothetical protein